MADSELPHRSSENGQALKPVGERAPTSDERETRIAELEESLRGAELQIQTLTSELFGHDSRIGSLQAAVTASAQSFERLETSLKRTKDELSTYQRRVIELQTGPGAALSRSVGERQPVVTDQTYRSELERLNRALQRSQLDVAAARSRELIAVRACSAAQQAYQEVIASPSWRATLPIRFLTGALPAKLRSIIARVAKVAYWIVTPLSLPRRFRSYQARRRAARRFSADYDLVTASQYFDAAWYLSRYPDVAAGGEDPLSHYLVHGAAESRDPGPSFDTSGYVAANADVAASGLNPLVHYLRHGFLERRPVGNRKTAKSR